MGDECRQSCSWLEVIMEACWKPERGLVSGDEAADNRTAENDIAALSRKDAMASG